MYLVLVAGGHASGKRTVTQEIRKLLKTEAAAEHVTLQTHALDLRAYAGADTAHPEQVNFTQLGADLDAIERECGHPAASIPVVFVYGNYALYNSHICERAQLRVFLDTDADERLSRWILRDAVHSTKLNLEDVLQTYLNQSRTEFSDYIEGTKTRADVLLPQGSDPLTAQVIVSGIVSELMTGETSARIEPVRRAVNLRNEENGMFYVTD